MKTLREYIDQLDEISRRDFLKGAGATAGLAAMGAPKDAQAQVGAGENESVYAANQAIKTWKYYAKDNDSVTKWIYDTIRQRCMQFYQLSGGANFEQATTTALQNSASAVEPTFLMFYQAVAQDKEDASIFKAILGGALGLESLSRSEQQKMLGTMNRVDLRRPAGEFVQVYTDSLNQSLAQNKPQQNQQLDKNTMTIINTAIGLYIVSKDPTFNISGQEIKTELDRAIKKFNIKDYVNNSYNDMAGQFNNKKASDPKKYQEWSNWYKSNAKSILSDINKVNGPKAEFEEGQEVDEDASPDAVKRIEQLVQYK